VLPSQLDEELRSVDVASPGVTRVGGWFELSLDEQTFQIGPWLDAESRRSFPRAEQTNVRTPTIREGKDWEIECETTERLEVLETIGMTTRCLGAGKDDQSFELFLDGWPRVEGLIVMEGREFVVSSNLRTGEPNALFVESQGEVWIVVAVSNRVWIRRGLNREERRVLTRIAAVLWASPELRAY
jgi:hypothetical protein